MKPLRLNKVIGLAIGERSLIAAEVVAGDRPEIKRLAEFVYTDGISTQQPQQLGTALGAFLRDNKFTGKAAVVGLPARWLVVKPKEVPPADAATLANLLRLQAEGEFSTELKDLVYDYAADTSSGNPTTVLLLATSKRYIDAAVTLCEAAKLNVASITPSAIALGAATSRSAGATNPLVLAVSPAGAELTSQSGDTSSAIRHLRGPGPDRPFVGELRRAISGMPRPSSNGTARELVLWDAAGQSAFDSASLGESLGVVVHQGELATLGVDSSGSELNGDSRKYAAAVSLALSAMVDGNRSVDFLHSRLAPPKPPLIPHWMMVSILSAIAAIALIFWAYTDLQTRQEKLTKIQTQLASVQDQVKQADAFVTKVSFAQAWHLGSPRYLACMRDLTNAIPQDGHTYALSLSLRESVPAVSNTATPSEAALKSAAVRNLIGRLDGKTTDQQGVQQVLDKMKTMPAVFTDVKLGGTQDAGRAREVSFTINFTYIATKVSR